MVPYYRGVIPAKAGIHPETAGTNCNVSRRIPAFAGMTSRPDGPRRFPKWHRFQSEAAAKLRNGPNPERTGTESGQVSECGFVHGHIWW